jgi:hypothetical protein
VEVIAEDVIGAPKGAAGGDNDVTVDKDSGVGCCCSCRR